MVLVAKQRYSNGLSEISSIGELFRSLRERSRMSQADVERVGGPKQSLQSRVERGEIKTVSEETIRSYAQALGMSVEKLRQRIKAADAGQITEPLRLGFIHGISAAPIIAMLMDGQIGPIIAASMVDENKELHWSEPGVAPIPLDRDRRRMLTGLQGRSLEDALHQLDLVVAPSDRLAGYWKEGGPLLRYAQISSQSAFDFMIFAPLGVCDSPDSDSHATSSSKPTISDYERVDLDYKEEKVKIFYCPDTLAENFAIDLVRPDLQQSILVPFSSPDQIEVLLKSPNRKMFRAIVPFPLSSNFALDAKREGWQVHPAGIDNVFQKNGKYGVAIPRYPIDILLRRDSPDVIEWLNGEAYDRFSDLIRAYEDRLSSGTLLPMHAIVRNIATYLGIDPLSCTEELNKCPFNLMHYPEFTRFLLNVRTRRIT